MRTLLRAPSPSMVVALVALSVALAGTGYAAFTVPANSVGTKQLKNDAVTTEKLKNRAVTGPKLNLSGVTVPNAAHANRATSALSASTVGSEVNWDGTGSAAGAESPVGKLGPYAVAANCLQSGGSTTINIFLTGPGAAADGLGVETTSGSGTAVSGSGSAGASLKNTPITSGITSSSTTPITFALSQLWRPQGANPFQLFLTVKATGSTVNTCHMSASAIPLRHVAAASARSAITTRDAAANGRITGPPEVLGLSPRK